MSEPWYAHDDTVTEITYTNAAGEEVTEPMVIVDQAIVDAGY
jgi:simple sugar transport system substrate-binding protein